jgi:hypothetical protein
MALRLFPSVRISHLIKPFCRKFKNSVIPSVQLPSIRSCEASKLNEETWISNEKYQHQLPLRKEAEHVSYP